MPALNPFLRALFQSSVLGPALTAQHYILLVPTTESLLQGRDRDSGRGYADFVEDEDFLGSHILRLGPQDPGAGPTNVRETRGKAKTYVTVNSKTVIVKESLVYTNKGFKALTQAQLLTDTLYHSPTNDLQQWLVIYITKPLVGTFEKISIIPAVLGKPPHTENTNGSASERSTQPVKKDIRSFNDLMNNFPMIARQMQPGLERVFNEFGKELGKPLPPPPSKTSTQESLDGSTHTSATSSTKSNGLTKWPSNQLAYFEDEEDMMRRAMENAVTAAIDLFQGVDKQQLSFLGATTELTGPTVERLIERYVAETVHESLLFPRLCAFHRVADHDLDHRIRQMECIDASQVGIAIENGRDGKQELLIRISKGVTAFRKMGVAGSPQQMLDVLLETIKNISEPVSIVGTSGNEKQASMLTINADILVSLLLLVVIRSQIRHLQARLSYMQRFIYIDDVDSGELGYALSTLEAVLTYLAVDSAGLRKASKQNSLLWGAVKDGSLHEVRAIFEGASDPVIIDEPVGVTGRPQLSRSTTRSSISHTSENTAVNGESDGNLAHVFPFQAASSLLPQTKKKKRVHMDARSLSISSTLSLLSRTTTLESTLSGIESDISIQSLAQTLDPTGNSILMMAVESQQPNALRYLLSLSDHYPPNLVIADASSEGTTLLSASIQLGHAELIDILLDYIQQHANEDGFQQYLAKTDSRGRTAAHYLFNAPDLINRLARLISWLKKDKIGHTPLFAICRTYDHIEYSSMVSDALAAAKMYQNRGGPLRIPDHNDLKGNTLLHIINDPVIMHRVLTYCDADPNAMNDRKFTPLMLASKYGRVDMVRVFFGDPRVDLHLREARGLTAVELAKDDEVRNRIDDLTLFSESASSQPADTTGRITSIVRSFFVEDGSTRYIVKSGAPNPSVSETTYTITTSKRSLIDFSNLARWLSVDHPASYLPAMSVSSFRSPFQLHSRPSRSILYDHQLHLDRFLKILMAHPTFSMHEMLWEFFLVPDMQQEQMEMRANLKAEYLKEKIADDFEPLTDQSDLDDVESMMTHSRDIVRRINVYTRGIVRRGYIVAHAVSDMAESLALLSAAISTLAPPSAILSVYHTDAISQLARLMLSDQASSPLTTFTGAMSAFQRTIAAIQTSLLRPKTLSNDILSTQRRLERHRKTLSSNSVPRKGLMNIQLPGMEESRLKALRDTEQAIAHDEMDVERKGKDLRYTQETVVGELAGWTTWKESYGRQEIRRYAKMSVIRETERLRGMQRALDTLRSKIE